MQAGAVVVTHTMALPTRARTAKDECGVGGFTHVDGQLLTLGRQWKQLQLPLASESHQRCHQVPVLQDQVGHLTSQGSNCQRLCS